MGAVAVRLCIRLVARQPAQVQRGRQLRPVPARAHWSRSRPWHGTRRH